MLRAKGHTRGANALLSVLAVPPLLVLLYALLFIILQPDMK